MNDLMKSYLRGAKATKAEKDGKKMGMKKEKKTKAENAGNLDRMTIEKADNGGFIVRCSYETKSKGEGKGGMAMPVNPYEEKEFVFKNADDLMDFVGDMFEG